TLWGMVPTMAANANKALELIQRDHQFDVAVVDMQMPSMNGIALAAEIHKLPMAAMLPVIFLMPMGAHTEGTDTHIAFAHSITKPVKPAQFLSAIERAFFSPKKVEAPAPAPRADVPLAERLPLRVLLVDDNQINQRVAARIVQQLGYKPDLAYNGKQALEAIDRQPYDLVFMDMMMPEMDGLEATRNIRERQKESAAYPTYSSRIFIIAMTAQAMPADRERCIEAGMDDYLAKPIRPNDVRTVIEKWATVVHSPPEEKPVPAVEETSAVAAIAVAPPPKPVEPAVDMSRMIDLTGGDDMTMRELIEMFRTQTSHQLQQIEEAVQANDATTVGQVAHSCKGASATLGMARFAATMLRLEKLGKSGKLDGATELCIDARREFNEVETFLSAQPAMTGKPAQV
ncbi:MAG TPA: response regulator, partial [Desulfuromonadaceae bacterium]|nr:response regulator [Desulfuromonadaceae bacterium]